MKVLVIGKGNLGIDMKLAFEKEGHMVYTLSRGANYDRRKLIQQVSEIKPDLVINCAGGYSVGECENRFSEASETLVGLLGDLLTYLPQATKLITFSSDYAQKPELSKYAMLKKWAEELVWHSKRANTAIFRVTSLYGIHNREACLPGKLLRNCPKTGAMELPKNEIVPTPTDWVAQMVVYTVDRLFAQEPMIYELYPLGSTTVFEFGQKVLGKEKVVQGDFDRNRPMFMPPQLQQYKYETWEMLWNQRRSCWIEHADQLKLFKQGRIK